MYKYGIELEMFYVNSNGEITIPPRSLPLDGCGAIVELRSNVHTDIYDATADIESRLNKLYDSGVILKSVGTISNNKHKFTQEEYRIAMKQSNKDYEVEINNIYGKQRRLLPRQVVAVSLQLNISNELSPERKINDSYISASYGLVDIHQIVSKLDKEFQREIKLTNRQAGEYAIKDEVRLEYRSLPSLVFTEPGFEKRIVQVMNSIK